MKVTDDPVIAQLVRAVEQSPDAMALRLHLAAMLAERGRHAEALAHCGAVLAADPTDSSAQELLQQCTAALAAPVPASEPQVPQPKSSFDWQAAENQVSDIIKPAFVDEPAQAVGDDDFEAVTRSEVRLADVGGMDAVKKQLELSLLGPLRNPELMKAYKMSARGGLLLYGPPGCGKSFIAKAVSGELGANFYQVGIADVLHRWFGESERSIRSVFDTARRNAPCVLFFDEVDALGHRRSALSGTSGIRTIVNTLLEELDSASSSNDGVYILGATNAPWDVDAALRRPGRFDRMVFVGLPDTTARAAIGRLHLQDRPVEGIDLSALAARTAGFSGADLAHVCDTATQLAMADSLHTGQVRPVQMSDVEAALRQVRPSTGPWFDTARNVVEFGNRDGTYDELAKYLRRNKIR
jgi:SpoVK/Ycf46/Vps4 family AAA+-type ATPase